MGYPAPRCKLNRGGRLFWARFVRRKTATPSLESHSWPASGDLPSRRLTEAFAAHEKEPVTIRLQNHLVPVTARAAQELLQPKKRRPAARGEALRVDADGSSESLIGQSSHGCESGKSGTTPEAHQTQRFLRRHGARSLVYG
jgi:hypothetical protein